MLIAHKKYCLALLCLMVSLSSCKKKENTKEQVADEVIEPKVHTPQKLKILLMPKNNASANGKVIIKQEGSSVTITALVSGLVTGEHPVYIQKEGMDKILIGNLITDENGNGTISKTSDAWCIDCEDKAKDIKGKSIVVLSGQDNHTISCAGIIE